MSESNERHLFTCTGFDFFVDRCEGCDKKPECEKYEELLNDEGEKYSNEFPCPCQWALDAEFTEKEISECHECRRVFDMLKDASNFPNEETKIVFKNMLSFDPLHAEWCLEFYGDLSFLFYEHEEDECVPDCGSGDDCRHCDRLETCIHSPFNPDNQGTRFQDQESEHFESCIDCDVGFEDRLKCEFCDLVSDDDLPF